MDNSIQDTSDKSNANDVTTDAVSEQNGEFQVVGYQEVIYLSDYFIS